MRDAITTSPLLSVPSGGIARRNGALHPGNSFLCIQGAATMALGIYVHTMASTYSPECILRKITETSQKSGVHYPRTPIGAVLKSSVLEWHLFFLGTCPDRGEVVITSRMSAFNSRALALIYTECSEDSIMLQRDTIYFPWRLTCSDV